MGSVISIDLGKSPEVNTKLYNALTSLSTKPRHVSVLVTGHRGFIGRRIWRKLSQDPNLDYLVGVDLKSGDDCRDLFRDDNTYFDLVVHCAATVGGREGIDYNAALLGANNLQLDGALFEWALRAKPGRVVFFSSAASYPVHLQSDGHAAEKLRLMEDHINRTSLFGAPDESYGWAKMVGEQIAQRVRNAGVPVTVVRPFSSYDFDQDDDYPFPQFIKRAKRHDDPFDVWGDGTQVRDWIHVDDLVNAILALVDIGHDGPVNLGTGIGTSMDELARLCMEEAGYTAPIRHLTDKPIGVLHRVCDNTRLLSVYEPKIDIRTGVRLALERAVV